MTMRYSSKAYLEQKCTQRGFDCPHKKMSIKPSSDIYYVKLLI